MNKQARDQLDTIRVELGMAAPAAEGLPAGAPSADDMLAEARRQTAQAASEGGAER